MEFIVWLTRLFPEINASLAGVIKIAVIISLFFGFMSSPVVTLLGIVVWLALMFHVFKRQFS
ncbi:hypothetical protein SAMN05660235_00362 [Sporolituus thermophilus DSM 23256]|uniref:Uncharacterized protein n=1 Tax=Sporolituus thermophilus DSM 23256 TaxID=1123285 RepID=A0A1G7I6E9_9FIRM|nr:hypothetical protein SAMN05660235_00362 [Sporolituus thermophilus DSM 23256]